MRSCFQRVVHLGSVSLSVLAVVGLVGCGGSSTTEAAAAAAAPAAAPVTQSDIVLPSSVQVVTAN